MKLKLFWVSLFLVLSSVGWAQKNPLWEIQKQFPVGGSDAPGLPAQGAKDARCELQTVIPSESVISRPKAEGSLYQIFFNTLAGNPCQIKIPLR